jgi:predicted metal-binding membrane protein
MTAIARRVAGAREVLWAHPQWWIIALGVLAWVPLVRQPSLRIGPSHHHDASVTAELLSWVIMVMAMMLPILAIKGRDVAVRSFAARRDRAIGLFLIGYLVPWLAFGVLPALIVLVSTSDSRWPMVVAFAGATLWAILPIRERGMLMSYGYTPVIAPAGAEADRDCVRAGLAVGAWCLVSCGPLMLACAISGHQLVAVIAGATIGIVESRSFRTPKLLVMLISAAVTALLATV